MPSMSSRKRKHSSSATYTKPNKAFVPTDVTADQLDTEPFIQAHEADLIRGPQARLAARSLEVVLEDGGAVNRKSWKIGDGLIRWGGTEVAIRQNESTGLVFYDEDDDLQQAGQIKDDAGVWVDRYASLREPLNYDLPTLLDQLILTERLCCLA
jgi:hypothetical protein